MHTHTDTHTHLGVAAVSVHEVEVSKIWVNSFFKNFSEAMRAKHRQSVNRIGHLNRKCNFFSTGSLNYSQKFFCRCGKVSETLQRLAKRQNAVKRLYIDP